MGDEFHEQIGKVEIGKLLPNGKRDVNVRELTQTELLEEKAKHLRTIEEEIYKGETDRHKPTASMVLEKHGFNKSDDTIIRLLPIVVAAYRDAFRIQTARYKGESTLDILQQGPSTYFKKDILVSEILTEYLEDTKPRIQTSNEWHLIFKRFVQIVGDKPIRSIDKSDIRKFRSTISQLPTRPNKAVRELPVLESIAYAERHDLHTVSVETIRKHIGAVRAVFEWAVNNDFLETNPANKMTPRKTPTRQKRLSFDNPDLSLIFEPSTYYRFAKTPADFWLPVISLYSGARIEEIAQLHIADVRFEENIAVFEIAPNSGKQHQQNSKRVKNKPSTRTIPIHKQIIKTGFMDFVDSCQFKNEERLFSELDRNKIGRLSGEVSRRFMRYIRSVGVSDERKVFHSFRHTFKDACRDAQIYEEVHDRLTGHSSISIGRTYGSGVNLSVLQYELNKVEYLGFPLLNWSKFMNAK